MSDREMRELLQGVIADIESGRVRVRSLRSRVVRYLGPPLLAASLGMAGCSDTGVAPTQDASVQDANVEDGGPQPAYMSPYDAMVPGDAVYQSPPVDAYVPDDGIAPAYMGPFDAGPEPDYMAPFDGGVEDGGPMPLYMGPPPQTP